MTEPKGMTVRRSYRPVEQTVNILQAYLQQHGATIYARIDQKAEGAKIGLTLPPLQLILFGNPKGGIPVMQENPLAALDLPLKIAVWEDEKQRVWLTYNKAGYLRKRYALPKILVSPLRLDSIVDAALKIQGVQGTENL